MNVSDLLKTTATNRPTHPGIVEGDTTTTYEEWFTRAGHVAQLLTELGITPGDRVALLARNSTEFLEALFGVFAAGAVIVPINTRLHPKEYDYILQHSGSKALIYEDEFDHGINALTSTTADLALVRFGATDCPPHVTDYHRELPRMAPREAEPRTPDALAWLFYTSGTTGRPKGAMVTHGNLSFMTEKYFDEVYPARPDDRALHAGPLTHGSGLWSIPLAAGGATQIVPASRTFNPAEVFALIERHSVTKLVFLAPTMIKMLLDAPESITADCSSLRFLGYGGAPIHPDDLRSAMDRWGEVMCNIFGQGECPMTISMLSPAQHAVAATTHPERLRSVGPPRGGIEVSVCDDSGTPLAPGDTGEICVRGAVVMRGYWEDPDATAEAFRVGWYHTGDLGTLDEDGYLYLLDRAKELVISGGANIYPREVENVLIQHPAVRDVAVFGIPDRFWGESVVAAIVLEPGETITEDEVEELCRENLASYKKPRHVVFPESLPRSAYGKVLKRELAESYGYLGG